MTARCNACGEEWSRDPARPARLRQTILAHNNVPSGRYINRTVVGRLRLAYYYLCLTLAKRPKAR